MSKLVQAGGTAKTTTTAALAVLLSRASVPVHVVDLAPQASLTTAFGCGDAPIHEFRSEDVVCNESLGGLLKHYERRAA